MSVIICAKLITSRNGALLMSRDMYMALNSMGSILKVHRVSYDSRVAKMPLPFKAPSGSPVFVT